ncbi:MAG: MFS transporter [Hyphomicrobiaceae bacterium]
MPQPAETPPPSHPPQRRRTLGDFLPPAFEAPRYRLFAAGQAMSVLGTWIQQVALAWLVFRITGSTFLLGLTGFLLQIPHLFIAPVAGFLIDRLPRVTTLVIINTWLAILATVLATVSFLHVQSIEVYLGIAILIGLGNACEAPTRQSLVGAIVEDRRLLPSAISFNSVMFNTGRMIGPAIAGVLLARFSESVCFLINAVSFIGIIGALIAMRLPESRTLALPAGRRMMIRASIKRLTALPVARYILPSATAVALCAVPLNQMMPSVAVNLFGGSAGMVGALLSASGIGALAAALFLSLQKNHYAQFRVVQVSPIIGGVALMAFSQMTQLWLGLPLLAVVGAFVLSTSVSTNTLLQQSVDDSWRGRVIGLYFMFFIGMAPFGNLMTGFMAGHIGLHSTLLINGAFMACVGIIAQIRLSRAGARQELRESVNL